MLKALTITLACLSLCPSTLIAETPPMDAATSNLVLSEENLNKTDNQLKLMEEKLLSQLGDTTEPRKAQVKPKNVPVPVTAKEEPTADINADDSFSVHEEPASKKVTVVAPKPSAKPLILTRPFDDSELTSNGRPMDAEQKLQIAESQVKILSRELDTTRKSLASAEHRIDELSSIVKGNYSGTTAPPTQGGLEVVQVEKPKTSPSIKPSLPVITDVVDSARRRNMEDPSNIATIWLDRAPLRIGPGQSESALFVIPKQSRVIVERRTGEWYRVVTMSGTRGWVYGGNLRFNIQSDRESTIAVKAYNPSYQPAGMKF